MTSRKITIVLIIGFIISFAVILVMVARNSVKPEQDKEKNKDNFDYVAASIVNNDTIIDVFNTNGIVQSSNQLDIIAEVAGKYEKGDVRLKPGVKFKKGQVLVVISDREYLVSLRARKASFISMMISLKPDIELEFPDEVDKWNKYINSLRVGDKLPKMPTSITTEKERNFLYSRNVFTEYLNIRSQEERLKKYLIVAPFSGEVIDNFIEPGSITNPGTRLLSIIKSNSMEIKVPLTISQLNYISSNSKPSLMNEAGEVVAKGIFDRKGKVINQSTQSVDVFFKVVPEKGKDIYLNQLLTLKTELNVFKGYFELPRTALNNDSLTLWTSADSSVYRKKFSDEIVKGENLLIKGLKEGDVVLLEEFKFVNDSVKVIPIYN
jgi:membrane fusion protein, multidrug efflux system